MKMSTKQRKRKESGYRQDCRQRNPEKTVTLPMGVCFEFNRKVALLRRGGNIFMHYQLTGIRMKLKRKLILLFKKVINWEMLGTKQTD